MPKFYGYEYFIPYAHTYCLLEMFSNSLQSSSFSLLKNNTSAYKLVKLTLVLLHKETRLQQKFLQDFDLVLFKVVTQFHPLYFHHSLSTNVTLPSSDSIPYTVESIPPSWYWCIFNHSPLLVEWNCSRSDLCHTFLWTILSQLTA